MVGKPLAEILCEQLSKAKLTKFVILPHIYIYIRPWIIQLYG